MLDNKYHFKHCARTSYVTYFMIGVVLILSVLYFVGGLSYDILGYNLLIIFGGGILVGFLGLAYYRYKRKQKGSKWKDW